MGEELSAERARSMAQEEQLASAQAQIKELKTAEEASKKADEATKKKVRCVCVCARACVRAA